MTHLSLPFGTPPSANGKFGNRTITLNGKKVVHLHDGTDWPTGYETPLRAMGDGVISFKTYTALRGYQVGVTHPDGTQTGYNLIRRPSHLPLGRSVRAGDVIAYSGPHVGWQTSGAAATGPHTHAWLKLPGVGFVDMQKRLGYGFQSDSSTPIDNTPQKPKGEDDMIVVKNADTGHIFAVAPQYIHHLGSEHDVKLLAAVLSTQDEVHTLKDNDFRVTLAGHSIPLHFADPAELKKYNSDMFWSRDLETRRAQDDIWKKLLEIQGAIPKS